MKAVLVLQTNAQDERCEERANCSCFADPLLARVAVSALTLTSMRRVSNIISRLHFQTSALPHTGTSPRSSIRSRVIFRRRGNFFVADRGADPFRRLSSAAISSSTCTSTILAIRRSNFAAARACAGVEIRGKPFKSVHLTVKPP